MIGLPLGKQRGVGLGDEGVAGDERGLIAKGRHTNVEMQIHC